MAIYIPVDLTNFYRPQTLEIEDEINARSSARFDLVDSTGTLQVDDGLPIEIYDYEGSLMFGGFTLYPNRINPIGTNALFYSIEAIDYNSLADHYLVASSYVSQTAGYIVNDMITQYLSADGITAGTIEEGATIDVAKFPRIGTVTETIDQLAEICGFIWYIDFDKTLHFKSRTSETAPFNISDTAKIVNIQLKNDRSRYRNRQFIRGGVTEIDNSIVDEQPTPKPDGVTRTFVTRYPISQKPTIKINSVEVSPNDIGVNGVDGQGSPLKWYWSYNTNTVTQDDNETILSTSDTIEISYIGLIPLLVVVEDSTAITDRSGIERTSGIYESLENMPNINDKKQALDIAYGRLSKFTKVLKELTYQTFTNGLQVGQIQTVTLSKYNLSAEEFLIDRINIRDLDDNGTFVYDVHAIDGQSFGGWSNFFKNLIHQSNQNLVINNDEKLIAFKSINESETWSESYAYTVYACAVCAETLYPETTFYPC